MMFSVLMSLLEDLLPKITLNRLLKSQTLLNYNNLSSSLVMQNPQGMDYKK